MPGSRSGSDAILTGRKGRPARARPSDFELLRLAERAEARVWTDCVAAAPADVVSRLGLRIEPVADGIALVAASVKSLLYNRAFGFGLDRPIGEQELDAAIALYRRDAPFTIQPTPFAAPRPLRAWLDRRGLVAHFNWVRWIRDARAPQPARTDLAIETADATHAGEFLGLALEVFHEPAEVLPWLGHVMGRPGWTHYIARDAGKGVAIAALYQCGEVGWLGWGGTLASHRGRGAQSALIARRIADGRERGCRWFTVETAEDLPQRPNPSYRNVARSGFRVLCLRPSHAWVPPEAAAR